MSAPVNILLVDDKPQNLSVLESILDGPEYRLTLAQSAQEALLALVANDYALIVLDVRMPETSGFELAQMIKGRKKTKDIPIVFLTAHYAEDEHVLSGYSAGAVDYLTKPINPVILKSKVAVFAELYRKTQALDEANRALNLRNQELLVANKELEAFSYSVSHDLRAPLRHIDSFVQIVREEAESCLTASCRRYLDVISGAAKQMSRLIEGLLAVSRLGRAEIRRSPVKLDELLKEVLLELERDIEARNIAWEISPLPEIRADRALLKVVWTNLISNAVKYTCRRQPAEIRIGCADKPGEFEFFVRDNGAGFDMRHSDKLFGVFQRLHHPDEFEGTGIGLANVRRIITRHGGRTWAEGKVGEGATFYFALPKSANP
jgi:two-component system, sensor histidine kinase and response regulator